MISLIATGLVVSLVTIVMIELVFLLSVKRSKLQGKYLALFRDRNQEEIILSNTTFRFKWEDTDNRWIGSAKTYDIEFEDIVVAEYDYKFNILTLQGKGILTAYKNYDSRIVDEKDTQEQMTTYSTFQIMLSFEEKENIIDTLGSKGVTVVYHNKEGVV